MPELSPQSETRLVLYYQDTFDAPCPLPAQIDAMAAAANEIGNSGFDTVVLGQWHLDAEGGLFYNDSPLDAVIDALATIVDALKDSGTVHRVLLSFGPFRSDFDALQRNTGLFKSMMDRVRRTAGVDGLDWDVEQDYEQYGEVLVELTRWAAARGMTVTAAPSKNPDFWVDLLNRSRHGDLPAFAWWNLQLFDGLDYGQWIRHLDGLIPDPQSFLVPGFGVSRRSSPGQIRQSVSELCSTYDLVKGGSIWQFDDIHAVQHSTADYASAVAHGLGRSLAVAC